MNPKGRIRPVPVRVVSSPFFKANAVAVAGMLGLKLYSQRGMKGKQLAAVTAIMARPDFPQPSKGLLPRASTLQWGRTNLVLAKDKRSFEIRDAGSLLLDKKPATGNLADQQTPAGDDDLFLKLSPEEIASANRARLQNNLLLHLGKKVSLNPLRKFEIDELIAEGMIPRIQGGGRATGPDDGTGDEITGGQEAVAAYIQIKFPGVIVNKMDISNWQRMKFLPAGCAEQFPPSHNSGRNSKRKIDAWITKYLKVAGAEQALPGIGNLDYDRLEKKRAYEQSLKEDALWQQQHSAEYLLAETHLRTLAAAGMAARNSAREAIEKKLPKRFSSGLELLVPDPPALEKILQKLQADCVIVFTDWQRQTAQAIEAMTSVTSVTLDPIVETGK